MQRLQITPGGSILAALVIFLLVTHAIRKSGHSVTLTGPEDYKGEPRTDEWWVPLHQQLVQEATNTSYDVIFYGDSITESFRGTMSGTTNERLAGNLDIFSSMFNNKERVGKKIRGNAFGMAGDQTQHLLWRVYHGELSRAHPPSVAVLHIGTNNLGRARIQAEGEDEHIAIENAVPTVTKHVLFMLKSFHQMAPKTKILLVGLLPRGGGRGGRSGFEQPSIYTSAIEEINQHFAEFASQDGRVGYVDCTETFLTTTQQQQKSDQGSSNGENTVLIDKAKMPDGLHPEGKEGAKSMLECIAPAVDSLLFS
ncbi:putative Platelet-activating factor acetylhydrolase IB subunit alpha1 [Nannochloris sp. 'desiccata']|nr:hypothetical protein KSW81_004299 [Chlorella desiccata (nom. nud.)]KAH7624119.1 putative Platelet-activating factor acetylhydrolase IB subunit alpha1 [Chlorella desiccata (nom. nud.)]